MFACMYVCMYVRMSGLIFQKVLPEHFLRAIFPFSQNALESLYCSVTLTAGFRSVFISVLRNMQVSALFSGLN